MDVRQQETDIPAVRHTPADRPAFQLHFPADCGTFHGSRDMEHHLAFIRREYRERRDIMIEALNRYAPPGLSWNRPEGGYYLWCRLPEGVPASELTAKAAAEGVAVLPGVPTYMSPQK